MGQELVRSNPNDPWNIKALAYCLIDLIKEASGRNDSNALNKFIMELNGLDIDRHDEILAKSISHAKGLRNPQTKIITDAKALSKAGRHHDAVSLYRTAIKNFPNDLEIHESLGWELYKTGKEIFSAEKIDVLKAKQLLNEYIKLKNERPSLLHSLFLRYADKLIGSEGFNLVAFLRFWNLDNLTRDDYESYQSGNGKTYPSVAEKVIQHAAKDALSKNIADDMEYILSYINNAIKAFPENFWLTYYKAKLLLGVRKTREANEFAISVVKAKLNDYWAWDLLAETLIDSDKEKAFACYCKALLCKSEEKFLANVRMKLADLLFKKSLYPEAKYEVYKSIKSREQEGWKLTEAQLQFQATQWYQSTNAANTNIELYKKYATIADALLFDSLPWIKASLGNKFTTAKNPEKQKRKIYVAFNNEAPPVEIVVSEKRYSFNGMELGCGLKLKGEHDTEGKFQIYLLESRQNGQQWDIFLEYIGIIDNINYEKKLAHFIVDRKIDGVIYFENFGSNFNTADVIALKLASHTNDQGIQYSVLSCQHTHKEISSSTVKRFQNTVRISDGFGFTENDIFFDRHLIEKYNINDNDLIDGLAVLNFNRKKRTWGWKAIKVINLCTN